MKRYRRYIWARKVRCAVCGGRGRFVNPMTGQTVICDWCNGAGEVEL